MNAYWIELKEEKLLCEYLGVLLFISHLFQRSDILCGI